MAAPKTNRTKEKHAKTLAAIQATQLVNALQDHVLGRNGRENMKPTQITAALGLIKKKVPDLSATELSNPDGTLQPILNITHEKGK